MNDQEKKLVERDQARTHVAEVVDIKVSEGGNAIADMLTRIGERAIAAGMVILSTTISTNSYVGDDTPRLVVTIICHWQNREMLESINRQNQLLMNQPGPRRAN